MCRQRGDGTSPMASTFSQRKPSVMWFIHMSLKIAAAPSSMPQPPKMYAFSLAQQSVWPLRAAGLPELLGFSLGTVQHISPDLASLFGAMPDEDGAGGCKGQESGTVVQRDLCCRGANTTAGAWVK